MAPHNLAGMLVGAVLRCTVISPYHRLLFAHCRVRTIV